MFPSSAVAVIRLSARNGAAPSLSPVVRLSQLAWSEPRFTLSVWKGTLNRPLLSASTCATLRFTRGCFVGRQLDTHSSSWGFSRAAALRLGATVCALGFICGGTQPGALPAALSALGVFNAALMVHEAGHLAAARALRVAVREFSVGIGPQVAWWQGPTTTYSLRALPLAGYVSFLTPAYLAAHPASLAPGLRVLDELSAGRRAVVMAAGVTANVALAVAIVTWQLVSYGQPGVVTRPGLVIHTAEDWEGDQMEAGQQGSVGGPAGLREGGLGAAGATVSPRLQGGDVVLAVGGIRLPAGRDVATAFVEALRTAAHLTTNTTATTTNIHGADNDGRLDAAAISDVDVYRPLSGVKMTVLRTVPAADSGGWRGATAAAASVGASVGGTAQLVSVEALDALRYGTLSVAPNLAVGFVRPSSLKEGVAMTLSELTVWTRILLAAWRQALWGTEPSSSSGATAAAPEAQWVGPLGLIASATTAMMEQEQLKAVGAAVAAAASGDAGSGDCVGVGDGNDYTYSFSCGLSSARTVPSVAHDDVTDTATINGQEMSSSDLPGGDGCGKSTSSGGAADIGPGMNGRGSSVSASGSGVGSSLFCDDDHAILYDQIHAADNFAVREPSYLAAMGIQVNLQLAAFNLLPIPILDGGQLLLVALEALRGGRRLSPALERGALMASGLLMGCWVAVLSAGDVVTLADGAAGRLAAALE